MRRGTMFRCVVVGTDGGETAQTAVRHAIELSRRCRASLHVVHARRSGGAVVATSIETAGLAASGVEAEVDHQERLRVSLEHLAADLRAKGVQITVHCGAGEPADVIVRTAEEVGADLIVVGNRGMQRRFLGSVPNSVSHQAPCSVLIVRTT
jgi:nucleotide-binding universal stress UspA family protein